MAVAIETSISRHSIASAAPLSARFVFHLVLGYAVISASNLFAYTPDSPQVKDIIKKGITFLISDDANDDRAGAQALAGIALLKADFQPDHPKILKAVEMIRKTIPQNNPRTANIPDIYTAGMSTIFLVTLDPGKYRPEIECLLQFLYAKQKANGAWGYYLEELGDTSMTQYGVLSFWEAKQVGYDIPAGAMNAVAVWLLQTQDPSGGFGYKPTVAPEGKLLPQEKIRHSLTAAGGGSLYILTDFFQMGEEAKKN